MMRNRKGFTLVEVIVSIALLGLIAVGFLMAVTGYVHYISVTKTITQDIFQAQEQLELDIQTVKSNIRNGTTGGLTEQTFSVFGQSFVGYPLAQQVEQHKLNTVVGSAVPIDLPVPSIATIEAHLIRGSADLPDNHSYGKDVGGKSLTALGSYSVAAGEPSFINKIQWYVSRDGFNIPMETLPLEIEIGSRFPRFPEDYEPIPYANGLTLSGLDQYIGHHIIFAVTPVAKSLKMGSMASSDPLFVDGPPVLTDLKLHLDASTVSRDVASWVRTDGSDPTRVRYWLQEWPNLAAVLSSPAVPAAKQASPSLQPELVDVSYVEVVFPGVWGRLDTTETTGAGMQIASFLPSSGTVTVLLVARLDATTLSGPVLSGTNWTIGRQDSSSPVGVSLGTQRLEAASSTEGLDGEWAVYSAVISRNKLVFHIDKQEYTLALASAPSVSTGGITLNTSGADIAEVLVYSRDLSSSGDLESLKTWLFQKYKPEITPWSIRQLYPLSGAIEQGGSYTLPATVSARLVDGTKMNVPVDWSPSAADTSAAGTQTYVATAREDATKTTILTLQVIGIDSIPALSQTFFQHPGESFTLPTEVPALFEDGITRSIQVVWDSPVVDLSAIGTFTIQGHSVLDVTIPAIYQVEIIRNPVTGVSLSPGELYLLSGAANEVALTATITPEGATDPGLTWSTSNPAVMTVNNGTVRGISAGSAVITVASVSDPDIKATCTVHVDQPAELDAGAVTGQKRYYQNRWNYSAWTNISLTYSSSTHTFTGTLGVYSSSWWSTTYFNQYRLYVNDDNVSIVPLSGFEIGEEYELSSGSQTREFTVTSPGRIPTTYRIVINRN